MGENNNIPNPEKENNGETYIQKDSDTYISQERKHIDPMYSSMQKAFQQNAQKEKIIQIVGFLFICITVVIEIPILILAQRLATRMERFRLLRFVFIFILLSLITLLALYQFLVIYNWNKKIEQNQLSMTLSNYALIDQIRKIKIIIICILVLSAIFYWIFSDYIFDLREARNVPQIAVSYNTALRRSRVSLAIYNVFEIWQLTRWSKRNTSINTIEKIVLNDFPDIEELEELSRLNREED